MEPLLQRSFSYLMTFTHLTFKADLQLDLRQVDPASLKDQQIRALVGRKRVSTELRVDRTEVLQGPCLAGQTLQRSAGLPE